MNGRLPQSCKQVQDFILTATPDSKLARSQKTWDAVKHHTSQCADCAAFAGNLYSGKIKQELYSNISAASVTAPSSLVMRTKIRCRQRATQIQQQHERMWPIWISSMVACMWAIVSVPFLWQGFEWVG